MSVYQFRVLYDNEEDTPIFRDIEVVKGSSFKDLNVYIIRAFGLDKTAMSSFFVCDENWTKEEELTIEDMAEDSELPARLMSDVKVSEIAEEESRNIMFLHDFLVCNTFFLSLLGTSEEKEDITYPRLIRSVGDMPKKELNLDDVLDGLNLSDEDLYQDDDISGDENLYGLDEYSDEY